MTGGLVVEAAPSHLAPLLARNRDFAERRAHDGLSPLPRYPLLLVSCFDPRVDPAHFLGAGSGDALVIRNAGGRVTDQVVRDIALLGAMAERMIGGEPPSFEVAVVHHTRCGTDFLADPAFRRRLGARTGEREDRLAEQAVVDPYRSVRADVAKLRSSTLVPHYVVVSGHVYDVDTGVVTSVPRPTRQEPP